MAIKGLTDAFHQQRQLPKLRLGFIDESTKDGKTRKFPKNPDHFCFDPEEVPEVVAVYGEQPKEIHAILIGAGHETIMPTNYQFFISSGVNGKNWFLNCSGDGATAAWYALHLTKTVGLDKNLAPGYHDGQQKRDSYLRLNCGKQCPDLISGKCKLTSRIRVMLPRVSMTTVYEIVTHSENTAKDFLAAIQNAQREISFGQGMGVVFSLYKEKVEKQKMKADKSGTQVHHFSYLTCRRHETFWVDYKKEMLEKVKISAGLGFKNEIMKEMGINPSQIDQIARAQVAAADEYISIQAPPPPTSEEMIARSESSAETIDMSTGEVIDVPSESVNKNTSSLENDEEVIFLVKTTYECTGTPVPADGVRKAIAKYGTKEKLKAELEAYISKKGKSKKAPPEHKEATAQTPPPATKASEATTVTSSSDGLL